MPILERCWTPYITRPWTSVKYGSYYTAVYSTLFHVAGLIFCLYCLGSGDVEHSFGFYEHLGHRGTITLSTSLAIFCICMLAATAFLTCGIRQGRRALFLPWLIMMSIEILGLVALGVSFIATAYSRMYPIVFALILWCFDAFHIYCLLCVISQYQVLRDCQQPRFVILEQ